jgi:hypothetical protein
MRFGFLRLPLFPMALLLCGAGGIAPTQTTGRLITGHVYSGNTGEPLADAVVTLVSRSSQHHQIARTASDGSYTFRDLEPGQYNMAAYKPKFLGELYGLEPGGDLRGAILPPDQSIKGADFHLPLSPFVSAMKDDAFQSLYTSNERLGANFSSGTFSPDGRYLAVVVGDIVTGDPEQTWRYDLQTGELRAITERPTEATSPVVRHLLWKANSLYVSGRLRMKDRGFTVIATGGDIHETDVVPAEVKNFFANRARAEESDTSGVGPPRKIGSFVVKGEHLHGGDSTWGARKDGTEREFIVASAIQGSPVFFDNPAMAFYPVFGWRSSIVAFDMEVRHSQTLDLPTGLTTLLAAKQETDGFLLAYSVPGSCTVTENSEGEDLYLLGQVLAYPWRPAARHVCFVHFPYQHRAI